MNVHERTLRRVRHRLHDVDYGDMGEFQELEYLEQLLELVGAVHRASVAYDRATPFGAEWETWYRAKKAVQDFIEESDATSEAP